MSNQKSKTNKELPESLQLKNPEVKVVLTHPNARMPEKMTTGSACLDLALMSPLILHPGEIRVGETGLQMEIPEGYYLEIAPRSSIAKAGILLMNSPARIDSDYRGTIKLIFKNLRNDMYMMCSGDRVAQCELKEVLAFDFTQVKKISKTKRGPGGLGSTGK